MIKFTYNKKTGTIIKNKKDSDSDCTVRIKITKPRMSQWYENKVGDEFDAIESKTLFRVKFTNNTAGLVNKEDAEIIKFL
jgi:hypothetical protein